MARVKGVSIFFTSSIGVLLLATSIAAPQQSTNGRSLKIEDYYRLQTVRSVMISANGEWVSYTLDTKIEEDNSTRSEVYLVATDGSGGASRILHYGRDVTRPAFTNDGWFQYTADGSWKIDPANQAGPPLATKPQPPRTLTSPDQKWVVSLRDKPQPKQEPVYASDFERRHEERFKGAIFDWRDFQRDGQSFPSPNQRALPATQIVLSGASGGADKTLLDLDVRPQNLIWHPNGQLLLFIADSTWRDDLRYGRPDLWTVSVDGKVTRLTDDLYTYRSAAFSPEGKYISYIRSFGTDMVIEQGLNHGGPRDLFLRSVSGGESTNLTADWDLEPGAPRWSPDGRFLYFTATTGGESHLFRVSASGGSVEQVTQGARRLMGLVIDDAFATMAYTVGRHEAPPDVYVANIDASNERRLSDVHAGILSEIAFSSAERLKWNSYDGTPIEGWLMFPHGYDPAGGPYPMIVLSHGGPHSATGYRFNFKKQFFAANGYFVLDTNFRSSTGYGEAFKWATWGEWGTKDGQDVVSGLEYVLGNYPIDSRRVGHTGHSYGGFMTNWVITQYPDHFAAAISGAGISNWVSDYGTADVYRTKETEFYGTPWDAAARERMMKQSPLIHAGRVRTPTLFVHGENDQRVPYPEGEQMYFALKRRGIPTKMIQYADMAHGIRGHWNNIHRMVNELKWWNLYLRGDSNEVTAQENRP